MKLNFFFFIGCLHYVVIRKIHHVAIKLQPKTGISIIKKQSSFNVDDRVVSMKSFDFLLIKSGIAKKAEKRF